MGAGAGVDWGQVAIDFAEILLKIGGEALLRAVHGEAAKRLETLRPPAGAPTESDTAIEDLKKGDGA